MKNKPMNARKMRVILSLTLVVVIAAVAGGFLYAHKNLTSYATAISQLNADAATGDQSIATLKRVEARLQQEQGTRIAAKSIITDSNTFAETVVADVTKIALESGVTITTLEYVDTPAAGTAAPTAPTATTPPPSTTPSTPTSAPTAGVPAGVTKKSISVTIQTPVNYQNLMNFISRIEANQLKLQIASLSLTGGANGQVETQLFSIGAYVR